MLKRLKKINLFRQISQGINKESEKSVCEHKTTHSNTTANTTETNRAVTF